ncbi:28S rRNA (uridine-N(3))-methyltransferase-like [Tubulanus polymorphus]|uniref:28S rRNA (uridine-N(3))-methyltransferase-like n=1 Tax=Tubulanus polymorphus TaxID=672921 RepID=UPI003DA58A9D
MAASSKKSKTDVQKNDSDVTEKIERPDPYSSGGAWKKWNTQIRAEKRKWKEEKLIKKLKSKIRKKEAAEKQANDEKEVAVTKGPQFTVSIAVPGSILDNAQSTELRTYLAGQIARSAVVFNVDEIIVFDETGTLTKTEDGDLTSAQKEGKANLQLARILQYLECPQYLRKALFPRHKDLQYAGLLNPLDCPHHMRAEDVCEYRDGVVLNKPVKDNKGSLVDVGWNQREVKVDRCVQPGIRVTVKIDDYKTAAEKKKVTGKIVAPTTPRTNAGLYWGYSVRIAKSLSEVFTACPFSDNGYDCLIGTSERGQSADELSLPQFQHLLIVFGGVKGLEASLEADELLDVDDPSLLFNHYINTCPDQGSRTIRTEEAILITMSTLQWKISEKR